VRRVEHVKVAVVGSGLTAGLRRWPNQPPPGSECEALLFQQMWVRRPLSGRPGL
jgi:hypothetical protein